MQDIIILLTSFFNLINTILNFKNKKKSSAANTKTFKETIIIIVIVKDMGD